GYLAEYAGLYEAAHSKGNNSTSIGVVFYNAVGEPPTPAQIEAFRFLRRHLVEVGALTADHQVKKHKDMGTTVTPCPGAAIEAHWGALSEPYASIQPSPPQSGSQAILGASQVFLEQAVAWALHK